MEQIKAVRTQVIEQRWRQHRTFAASAWRASPHTTPPSPPSAWMRRGLFVYCRRTL